MSDAIARLGNTEDNFTERKPPGVHIRELRAAIVGFANSLPVGRTAILYVGVSKKGEIVGVDDPDKLQRDIRDQAENHSYPPIYISAEAIGPPPKQAIAITVPHSLTRPHFGGLAHVRRGSETIKASEQMFELLVTTRASVARFIQDHRDSTWTVEAVDKRLGGSTRMQEAGFRETAECTIEDLTPHFVRFKLLSVGSVFTEVMDCLRASWDDERNRPKLITRFTWR